MVVVCTTTILLLGSVTNPDDIEIESAIATHPVYQNQIFNVNTSSSSSGDSNNGSPLLPDRSNASWDDLRPLAIELSNYVGANGHGYTSYHGRFDAHAGCNGYDSSISDLITITFDNVTRTANATQQYYGLRSDCSGGVSAMLFFMGVTGNGENIANTTASCYCSIGTSLNVTKFSELQVGDILSKSSHVGMVAYKDSEKVYMFDWDSTDAIEKCKAQGYYSTYDVNADISTWRSGTVYARRLL